MSIGKFVRETILANATISNDEILTQIKERFPTAKTTTSCIAWYKSDMRKKGLLSGGRAKAVMKEDPMTKARRELEEAQADLANLTDKAWIKNKVQSLKLKVADLEAEIQTLEEDQPEPEAELDEAERREMIRDDMRDQARDHAAELAGE